MRALLALAAMLYACDPPPADPAAPSASDAGPPDAAPAPAPKVPCPKVVESIQSAALKRHLENYLQIAKQHDGNRARASGGYAASVAYVLAELREVGHTPRRERFDVSASEVLGPGVMTMNAPRERKFLPGRNRLRTGDFTPVRGSPPGEVTADVAAVAVQLGANNRSVSGCYRWQFDDGRGGSVVAGKIALLQRGDCPFAQKVFQAQSAGARAVVIFNQGDSAKRLGLMRGDLDGRFDHGIRIPVVFVTTAVGQELVRLLDGGRVELTVATDTARRADSVHNVILDLPGERSDEVLVLGAHLDSVSRGPGINDNATGSATLLELAKPLAGCTPKRTVRFAWWGAEEEGLLGSTAYVSSLDQNEVSSLVGYINLDMLGAPNYAFMLTDGDGSKTGEPAPASSGKLEAFFRSDFESEDLSLLEVPYAGRSDDQPFYDAGVGVVMLGAGYDGLKKAEQVFMFGGRAGEPYDPCYHRKCDDLGNVDHEAHETITKSVARAVQHFAIDGAAL